MVFHHRSWAHLIYGVLESMFLQIFHLIVPFLSRWEVLDGVEDKVVVITGANTGLGECVARNMAAKGCRVIIACRDLQKGRAAMKSIMEQTGSTKLDVVELDLTDLESVRRCGAEINAKTTQIDIIINNAGISQNYNEPKYTVDGFERHMGTNHLGHFLLTQLLLEKLKKGREPRVVSVVSVALILANLCLTDMRSERCSRGFLNTGRYSNSKFANAVCSKEMYRRMKSYGIKTYSLCPGFVKGTSITREYNAKCIADAFLNLVGYSVETGANMILYCALGKAAKPGLYRYGRRWWNAESMLCDDDFARRLWDKCESLVEHKLRKPPEEPNNNEETGDDGDKENLSRRYGNEAGRLLATIPKVR